MYVPTSTERVATRAIVPSRTRFHVRTRLSGQPPAVFLGLLLK
jgi:hypothetical protein